MGTSAGPPDFTQPGDLIYIWPDRSVIWGNVGKKYLPPPTHPPTHLHPTIQVLLLPHPAVQVLLSPTPNYAGTGLAPIHYSGKRPTLPVLLLIASYTGTPGTSIPPQGSPLTLPSPFRNMYMYSSPRTAPLCVQVHPPTPRYTANTTV